MKIIIDFLTLISVIYALGCTAFLSVNSPHQYYKTAYVSAAIMIFFLLFRTICVLVRNSDNENKKSGINDTIMYLMYYFTGLFELNIRFGYGNTIGISGAEEKIGSLYTMGIPYTICNLLNILVFVLLWIILILKAKYAMNYNQAVKNKIILLLIISGAFITVKSTIGVLSGINDHSSYVDIAMAHIIYWIGYFISWLICKLLLLKAMSQQKG